MLFRFVRLRSDRREAAAAAAALQLLARVAIVCVRVDRLAALASAAGRARRMHLDPDVADWALAATRPLVGGTCLTQALAACVLHGWSGRPCRLVIGVRRGPSHGAPVFHAWTDTGPLAAPDGHTPLVCWD